MGLGGRPRRRMPSAVQVAVVDRFRPRTPVALVREAVIAALQHAGRDGVEVAVLLTGDDEIAALHGRFMDDPTETDVMSFDDDDSIDVVVNVARARREAKRSGSSPRAELTLYLVHGVLHCCGFDDHGARERAAMRLAESAVMRSLGLHHAPVDA